MLNTDEQEAAASAYNELHKEIMLLNHVTTVHVDNAVSSAMNRNRSATVCLSTATQLPKC